MDGVTLMRGTSRGPRRNSRPGLRGAGYLYATHPASRARRLLPAGSRRLADHAVRQAGRSRAGPSGGK